MGGAVLTAYLLRPRLSITPSQSGLASLSFNGPGTTIGATTAHVGGRTIPLADDRGTLRLPTAVSAGASVSVTVTARSPWWESWLTGARLTKTVSIPAPVVTLGATISEFRAGGNPTARFDQPVQVVSWVAGGTSRTLRLTVASRRVTLTLPAGHPSAGTVEVRAARYTWEMLSAPMSLTYFAGHGPMALVSPAPGAWSPSVPIRLTFAQPVRSLFGSRLPTLSVAKLTTPPAGTWLRPTANTLEFSPGAGALWPGQELQIHLPSAIEVAGTSTSTLSFAVPQGSVTRLQQELAVLGYLPFTWSSAAGQPGPPASMTGAAAAASVTPQGSFSWRWTPPALLAGLWQPGTYSVMTDGAVKAFENVEGLNPVGLANPLLWPYLAKALASNAQNPNGYTWVSVSQTLPETLTVWHDGQVAITAATNTGIPSDPTANGTFAVYLRYPSQVMRGTNPNGTTYADPVEWVSYFNGGDAIHGFVRASYGFPQSLGCAELPFATAAQVYPLTPIGTLVTVHP